MLSDEALSGLTHRSRHHGERPAVICGTRTLNFVEVDDRAARLGAALTARGICPGDVVSIYGPVGWEWVVAHHAVARIGAILNPINALLAPDEVGFILADCAARLLLADSARLSALEAEGAAPAALATMRFEAIDEVSRSGPAAPVAVCGPEDISTVFYTSGTTGRPKGAMLTHRAVVMNAGLTALMHGRCADDIVVTALPLAHVYGNAVMNSALLVGATLVLVPAFSPEAVFDAVGAHSATRLEAVPTMYYRMLESPALGSAKLGSLRMCTVGGQTMPVDKMESVEARFGCPLIELWGMSEIGGLGTTFPWTGPRTLGSIGIPLPGIQMRTVDPESRIARTNGGPGELQIRGRIVMKGYLGDDAATRLVLDEDGWLSTGDIGRIDDSGQVFILDRMKDVIFTSGNNVYPAEIERVISAMAGVTMVGVGRDPHPDKGEVPHAYVVADPAANLSAADVIEHCRRKLAPYKLPRAVTFLGDLPKTASGKIMRRSLSAAPPLRDAS